MRFHLKPKREKSPLSKPEKKEEIAENKSWLFVSGTFPSWPCCFSSGSATGPSYAFSSTTTFSSEFTSTTPGFGAHSLLATHSRNSLPQSSNAFMHASPSTHPLSPHSTPQPTE